MRCPNVRCNLAGTAVSFETGRFQKRSSAINCESPSIVMDGLSDSVVKQAEHRLFTLYVFQTFFCQYNQCAQAGQSENCD